MVVTLGGRKDALVMMGELDQVDAIALAVIGVDLLATFEVVKTHAEVLTARHEVLAVVADVHTVDLLFLKGTGHKGFQTLCVLVLLN